MSVEHEPDGLEGARRAYLELCLLEQDHERLRRAGGDVITNEIKQHDALFRMTGKRFHAERRNQLVAAVHAQHRRP